MDDIWSPDADQTQSDLAEPDASRTPESRRCLAPEVKLRSCSLRQCIRGAMRETKWPGRATP
uniref:Uncharacterized protein n=1 Tax=Setaria viridis TaxID=4556 RepID=A0A4U6TTY1_SETVI|nr:hypothetical protein SEVIR_7G185450v2 [Setaria viridis]